LRRLRQTGLLQHALDGHAPRVDEDGQAAEIDARSDEDLRPLRPAQVLLALRTGRVRGIPTAAAGGGNAHRHEQRTGPRTGTGDPGTQADGRVRGRPAARHQPRRSPHRVGIEGIMSFINSKLMDMTRHDGRYAYEAYE